VWVSTWVVASRHGTICPSYQMEPSRSEKDVGAFTMFDLDALLNENRKSRQNPP